MLNVTNVNEIEEVSDPLTRLAPLATLCRRGDRGQELKLTLPSVAAATEGARGTRAGEGDRRTLTM